VVVELVHLPITHQVLTEAILFYLPLHQVQPQVILLRLAVVEVGLWFQRQALVVLVAVALGFTQVMRE
jgi:hypothetical protein